MATSHPEGQSLLPTTCELAANCNPQDSVYQLVSDILIKVIYPMVLVYGILGSVMIILVMSGSAYQNVIGYYFRMLAISDMLCNLLCNLFYWITYTWPNSLSGHDVLVLRVSYYIGFVTFNTSVWLVTIIAVERFIAVTYPLKAVTIVTMFRARITLVVIIIYQVIFHFPHDLYLNFELVAIRNIMPANDIFEYFNIPVNSLMPRWAADIYMIIGFEIMCRLVPTVIIITMNVLISLTVIRQGKKTKDMKKGGLDKDLTKSMVMVSVAFVVLNTPYGVDAIYWNRVHDDLALEYPALRSMSFQIGLLLSAVNTGLNCTLYCLGSKQFYKELMKLMFRK